MRAHGFRVSFTPLSGVLFTFPSRYSSSIGLPGVLSLGGWCRLLRTGLLRPRPTQGSGSVGPPFAYGAVTRSGPPFQARSAMWPSSFSPALQPRARLDARGLGWPPFARRYSGGHSCFPFLRLLGCFGSSGSPPPSGGCRALARRVAPFGHPRINGRSRLPVDFRGLPRPSSPPGAKASSVRPNSLLALSCGARSRGRRARLSLLLCLLSFHPVKDPCASLARTSRAALSWRMRGSNPRPPACKAGALAD